MDTGLLRAELTGDDLIRVDPPRATLDQTRLALSNRGELVRIDRDVLGVAEALQRIDTGLELFYDKNEQIYVLLWKGAREKDGGLEVVEDLVGAYQELDQRIIGLIERIDAQGRGRTDLQTELDRLEAQKDAEHEWQQAQKEGEAGEVLRHAIRRDLSLEGSSVQLSSSRGIAKGRKESRRRQRQARKAQR